MTTADPRAHRVATETPPGSWCVYLLRCADATLYAGSTNDVDARVRAHNEGRGARYTSGRRPVARVYLEACATKSAALRREHAVKRLTRAQKEDLIRAGARDSRGGL